MTYKLTVSGEDVHRPRVVEFSRVGSLVVSSYLVDSVVRGIIISTDGGLCAQLDSGETQVEQFDYEITARNGGFKDIAAAELALDVASRVIEQN